MELQRQNLKRSVVSGVIAVALKKGKKNKIEGKLLAILRKFKNQQRLLGKGIIISEFLNMIVNDVKPYVGFRKKKVGSVTYVIPVSLRVEKENALAMTWIVKESCGRKLGAFEQCFYTELTGLLSGTARSLKKKEHISKVADANRGFVKYLF